MIDGYDSGFIRLLDQKSASVKEKKNVRLLNFGELNKRIDNRDGVWPYPLDTDPRNRVQTDQYYRGKSDAVGLYNGALLMRYSVHIREFVNGNYRHLDQCRVFDLITKAVPRYSSPAEHRRAWKEHPELRTNFVNRIRAVFWILYREGYNKVVLGPAGCGAFSNDPALVADVFYQVAVLEFPGILDQISVAYLCIQNPRDSNGLAEFQARFIKPARQAVKDVWPQQLAVKEKN